MQYWIHRCKYQGGFEFFDKENRLTIGFSDCANDEDMLDAIRKNDGDQFDTVYREIYKGEIWRSRYSLWYFTCVMKENDIVVIPRDGGFSVCKLIGNVSISNLKDERDIGFEWRVEKIVPFCGPRESYATTGMLSRMKIFQTTACINDLKDDVESAISRFKEKKPFSLSAELSQKCYDLLDKHGSPEHLERLLANYFTSLGCTTSILPKNYSDKIGDCDVSAVFPALHLTISVQVKKHWGETGDWAVKQISEYAQHLKRDEEVKDSNWAYMNWVVSFARDFSDDAKELARKNGVILINGDDFCRMLIAGGLNFNSIMQEL